MKVIEIANSPNSYQVKDLQNKLADNLKSKYRLKFDSDYLFKLSFDIKSKEESIRQLERLSASQFLTVVMDFTQLPELDEYEKQNSQLRDEQNRFYDYICNYIVSKRPNNNYLFVFSDFNHELCGRLQELDDVTLSNNYEKIEGKGMHL